MPGQLVGRRPPAPTNFFSQPAGTRQNQLGEAEGPRRQPSTEVRTQFRAPLACIASELANARGEAGLMRAAGKGEICMVLLALLGAGAAADKAAARKQDALRC